MLLHSHSADGCCCLVIEYVVPGRPARGEAQTLSSSMHHACLLLSQLTASFRSNGAFAANATEPIKFHLIATFVQVLQSRYLIIIWSKSIDLVSFLDEQDFVL
jgi:hypothetical protein